MYACDRLLRNRRDLREGFLHLSEHGVGDAAVPIRGERDHGRDRERHERELPAVHEENHSHDDDGHNVLSEEDQPVAEEKAHRLEVDRRPRHELPRLAAVVEAEGQSKKMRVEIVTKVVLHRERLSARDHPAPVHENSAHEPEPYDGCDLEGEQARVGIPRELVDDNSRDDRHQDARYLRGDREE